MSAVVLDFQQAVRRRAGVAARHNTGLGVDDAITQAVMETFAHYPLDLIAAAIQSARASIANGAGFIRAMDAAAHTIAALGPAVDTTIDDHNFVETDLISERRERRNAAMGAICERMIRAHLKGRTESEITVAIKRANRVIVGGGSLCTAIYHATNIDVSA